MIKTQLRLAANRLLAHRGLEISHRRLESSPIDQLMLALKHFDIDLVIDVGANTGHYARELFAAGYAGEIDSVEPLPDVHSALVAAAQEQPRWNVLEQMALGDSEGTVDIHIAGNSLSSSILPMLDRHVNAAPSSATIGRITVPQRTLDAVCFERISNCRNVLLKIDTQGYEPMVLLGAERCLQRVRLVQLEMSLEPLYEGQQLWLEVVSDMLQRGFTVWAVQPEFCDPQTGQMLQINGLFVRT